MPTAVRSGRQPAATSRSPRSLSAEISHWAGAPRSHAITSAGSPSSSLHTTPFSLLQSMPVRTANPNPISM